MSSDSTKESIIEILSSVTAIHGSKAGFVASLALDIISGGMQHGLLAARYTIAEKGTMQEAQKIATSLLKRNTEMANSLLAFGLQDMPENTKAEIAKLVMRAAEKLELELLKSFGFKKGK